MDTLLTPLGLPESLLDRFSRLVGKSHVVRDPDGMRPFLTEWRGQFSGRAAMVIQPGSAEEISAIMALASETRTRIVPQGGNTGLVGAQIPSREDEIVLSLSRLNRILDLNPDNNTLTAQAGCTLSDIHDSAKRINRLFPLRIASEGTSQIGGNISTNAGGINTLSYGVARNLVLGLEVVLADGQIWNGLRGLRKDSSGYDLKHLFIGAEGTLGVITAATLSLSPIPGDNKVLCIGLSDIRSAVTLLHHSQAHFGHAVTAFELLSALAVQTSLRHTDGAVLPLRSHSPWYVLMEIASFDPNHQSDSRISHFVDAIIKDRIALDGISLESGKAAEGFKILRLGLSQAQKREGGSIKHDISLPINAIPSFMQEADGLVQRLVPGARILAFGHLGDGNLHYNISQPVEMDTVSFLDLREEIHRQVYALVLQYGGSISAEHGIGQLKRDLLPVAKSGVEIELMRRIKTVLDPRMILNPGKLLQSDSGESEIPPLPSCNHKTSF